MRKVATAIRDGIIFSRTLARCGTSQLLPNCNSDTRFEGNVARPEGVGDKVENA